MQTHRGDDEVLSAQFRRHTARDRRPAASSTIRNDEAPSAHPPALRSPLGAPIGVRDDRFRFSQPQPRHSQPTSNPHIQRPTETSSRVPIETGESRSLFSCSAPSENSSVPHTRHIAGRNRNTPVAPITKRTRYSAQADSDIDPPTLQSLSSATEDEDLGRIRKLLSSNRAPFATTTTADRHQHDYHHYSTDPRGHIAEFDSSDTDNTDNRFLREALRDEQRLEAARRGRFGHTTTSSADFGHPTMSRRRNGTGEELVLSPNLDDYNEPFYAPERPVSAASLNSLTNDPLAKSLAADRHYGRLSHRRESVGSAISMASSGEYKDERPGRSNGIGSRARMVFGRGKSSTEVPEDAVDWDGSESGRKSSSSKGRPPSSTGSIKSESGKSDKGSKGQELSRLPNGQSGKSVPFQNTQKRAQIRSPKSTNNLNGTASKEGLNFAPERPVYQSASIHSVSRIPAPSPTQSRPASSNSYHETPRRSFSTVTSKSDRRPPRPPSSTSSLVGRTSTPNSPTKRQIPVPSKNLNIYKTSNREDGPTAPKAIPRRADTAPRSSYATEPELHPQRNQPPHAESPEPPLDPENKPSERQSRVESFEAILREIEGKDHSPEQSPLAIRKTRPRGISVDSFMRRSGNMPSPPITPGHTPKMMQDWDTSSIGSDGKQRDHIMRSPALSDYDDLLSNMGRRPSVEHGGNRSPLFGRKTKTDRVTKAAKAVPQPKSALEDEDSDVDESLNALVRSDAEYEKLLSQRQNPDDDTFQLLGGSQKYEPQLNRRVRKREEAQAGDLANHSQTESHDKLMNRLKTLHIELRSARQGIEYVERKLNGGISSDDESEWVDDDSESAQRLKAEMKKQRKEALALEEETLRALSGIAPPTPPSKIVRYGVLLAQLVAIYFLTELALYLHAFPSSSSTKSMPIAIVPTFGNQIYRFLSELFRNFPTSALLSVPKAAFGFLVLFWRMLFSNLSTFFSTFLSTFIATISKAVTDLGMFWTASTASPSTVPINEPPAFGADPVMGI